MGVCYGKQCVKEIAVEASVAGIKEAEADVSVAGTLLAKTSAMTKPLAKTDEDVPGTSFDVPEIENLYFDSFVKTLPSMRGKRVAITGCTTGTGFVTALTVARAGASIVMLNRPSERATNAERQIRDAVPGVEAVTITCDLQSMKSVSEVASLFAARFPDGGLDVLVCNAGVLLIADQATEDGFDIQVQTNHLSHFMLVRDLMPELEKAAAATGDARVVHATSNARNIPLQNGGTGLVEKYFGRNGGNLGGNMRKEKWMRYGQSKMANAVFHYALHDKLQEKGSNVRSLLSHPGLAATSMQATCATAAESAGLVMFLEDLLKDGKAQSEADGAMAMLACIGLPDVQGGDFYGPKDAGVLGPGTKGEAVKITPESQHNTKDAKDALWDWSEKAFGQFRI
jgi:NAD(P)-dependent dehydrogenase (short-subunit alcohol dehydrogenase family)